MRRINQDNETRVSRRATPAAAASLCNTLQHTAPHCNTLQHTTIHCNTLRHTAHRATPAAAACSTHCFALHIHACARLMCLMCLACLWLCVYYTNQAEAAAFPPCFVSFSCALSPSISLLQTLSPSLLLSLSLSRPLSFSLSFALSFPPSLPPSLPPSFALSLSTRNTNLYVHS